MKRFGLVATPALLIVSLAQCVPLNAQEAKPDSPRTVALKVDDLVSVKPAKSNPPAIVLEMLRPGNEVRRVPVREMRSEDRTRLVQVKGKVVEQQYTVMVPITKMVEQRVRVRKEVTVPVGQLRGWNVSGKPIGEQELIDRLAAPRVVFRLSKPLPENAVLDNRLKAVLRDDVLLLYIAPRNTQDASQ